MRSVLTWLTALLVMVGVLAGCTADPGSGEDVPETTEGPAPTSNSDPVIIQTNDPPTGEVILAPVKVPPFGGDAEFSPHTITRFIELITERCGGTLCLDIDFDVTPPGVEPDDEFCEITGIEPGGAEVEHGATVEVAVNCESDPGSTEEPDGEGETGATEGQ